MTGEAPTTASSPPTEVPTLASVESRAPDGRGRTAWGQGGVALAIGSVGVVFGDIGTSPLYAMREALAHARHGADGPESVFGVVSLIIWTLVLIVTIKYVVVL
ncbi:MAG TPA: KUP/HAK/KT family potassium transporter, partial [Caulobacteraceae bacterium]